MQHTMTEQHPPSDPRTHPTMEYVRGMASRDRLAAVQALGPEADARYREDAQRRQIRLATPMDATLFARVCSLITEEWPGTTVANGPRGEFVFTIPDPAGARGVDKEAAR